MKKLRLGLIAATLMLAMTGCAKEETKKAEKPKTAEKKPTKQKQEDSLTHGTWNDHVYYNSYLNLSFQLPDGFIYANDEQLAKLMNITVEDISEGSELTKEILKQRVIIDMAVQQSDNGSGVNLVLEDLSAINGYQDLTEADYAEAAKDLLEKQGAVIMGTHQEVLAGESYVVIASDTKPGENVIHNEQYCKKYGKYMLVITFSYEYTHENYYDQLKANFHKGSQGV